MEWLDAYRALRAGGLFVLFSGLLAVLSWAAFRFQRRLDNRLSGDLGAFTAGQVSGASAKEPARIPPNKFVAGAWIAFSLGLAAYPFVLPSSGEWAPLLVRELGPSGAWVQLFLGLGLWAPALALATGGLWAARGYAAAIWRAAETIKKQDASVSNAGPDAVQGSHVPLLRGLETSFAAWGLVGAVAVTLVFSAKRWAWLGPIAAIVVVVALGGVLLPAWWRVARQAASRSAMIRPQLVEELERARRVLVESVVTGAPSTPLNPARIPALAEVVAAMPPTTPWGFAWHRFFRLVLGVLGPPLASIGFRILVGGGL